MSVATLDSSPRPTLLSALQPQAPDGLLALIGMHARDPRADKIDVGVGVYRDPDGKTPVFLAVKKAEALLLTDQDSKSYLGPEGDARFTALLAEVVFGSALAASHRLAGVQTPGGTGALRLGAELLARAAPGRTVWVGTPTWANHAPLFEEAGLRVRDHRFFDPGTSDLDFAGMIEDLNTAEPGDILLLHGCCHNPSGVSLNDEQWRALSILIASRSVVPFVDLAYQGLGDGLDEDAFGTRLVLESAPEALIAYSCDKNFGLYRERVGALWVWAPDQSVAQKAEANLFSLARAMWSMPPDHGAAVVRTILDYAPLRDLWLTELTAMRRRIWRLRISLAEGHPRLEPIGRQAGMFALLPLAPAAVAALREEHGIYMAGNGRINIAGLKEETIHPFVRALESYLGDKE
jgi:aromatic-amino-acid transaminase